MARLTDCQIEAIADMFASGSKIREIADKLCVSIHQVARITANVERNVTPPNDIYGEEWKVIPETEGIYYVSNMGRVFSSGTKRRKMCGVLKQGRTGRVDAHGRTYRSVSLFCNGTAKLKKVHRLVAEAFCPGHDDEHNQVNHKDGNKENNRADNLEWVNQSQNVLHSYHVLGAKNNPHRKFTDEQVRAIRNDERGCKRLARAYDCGTTTIKEIRNRKRYAEVI